MGLSTNVSYKKRRSQRASVQRNSEIDYLSEAERVGKYMVRPVLSLDRLLFLDREGQVGYRHGPSAAGLERMDYLEFIARVTSHIPDKGQVMVRYYGLYANAHRWKVKKANRGPVALGMIEEEPRPSPSKGWAEMIRKVYEVDPLICPRCGGRMKVVAFLTEYAVVDRIIRHLELTFVAEKPPPAHVFEQVALMAAEERGDYDLAPIMQTPRKGWNTFQRGGNHECNKVDQVMDVRGRGRRGSRPGRGRAAGLSGSQSRQAKFAKTYLDSPVLWEGGSIRGKGWNEIIRYLGESVIPYTTYIHPQTVNVYLEYLPLSMRIEGYIVGKRTVNLRGFKPEDVDFLAMIRTVITYAPYDDPMEIGNERPIPHRTICDPIY
jgi:hypothetical protein